MLRERIFSYPVTRRDQVTAVEVINGIACRIVLEQDAFGIYRETAISPLHHAPAKAVRASETCCSQIAG